MSDTTDLSIIENQEKLDQDTLNATTALTTFAQNVDDELANKLVELARQTSPVIKGLEGETKAGIPRIYLRQPSSSSDILPEDCGLGQLYSSKGVTLGDSVSFIPVLTHNLRKKWGEEQLECLSLDGKIGTRYGSCGSCPYGKFEKGSPPSCSPGFSYYGVTDTLSKIYQIDFLKSSANAGKNIRRLILPPALWSRSFTITTEKKTGTSRNYYVFKTSPGAITDEQTAQVCDILHGFFKTEFDKAIANQKVYAQRLADSQDEATPQDTIIVEDADNNIDFSDGM